MNCLHTLFREQAARTPDTPAVVGPDRTLTFRQLDQESDSLAGFLVEKGIRKDHTVGLFLERSTDYVVACLAALKAGGAFLPLFLDYPERMLVKILEQTGCRVVLTSSDLQGRFPRTGQDGLTLLCLDTDAEWLQYGQPEVQSDPEDLMFVVYTSGTTGEPKGIELPHRAAVHSYFERYKISDYESGQRVGCNIFFVWEIFRPLLRGATVHVIDDREIYDPVLLARFMAKHRLQEVLFTPSLLETMLSHWTGDQWRQFDQLRVIWLNGEVVTERLRKEALSVLPESVRLLNTYSISECHDVASLDLRQSLPCESGYCPVGYPIDGISVRIIDDELYVGGPGLARGYLGKPHLTAERFVELDGQRCYRTGDLATQYDDGLLEIRGRCDSMVKIRGYSVQLGAVQSALEETPGVKAATARVHGSEGQEKTLVGYVVPEPDATLSFDAHNGTCPELREQLAQRLPDFMIPRLFVKLTHLPLNPVTGKLDTQRLPLPPQRRSRKVDDLTLESGLPALELLRLLFERLLGLEEGMVHRDSHFFHLGGHSLMAVRCVRHLERIFGSSVSVRQLYDYPTPEALLSLLTQGPGQPAADRPVPEDWTLEENVAPPEQCRFTPPAKARAILVTGGTGFVGSFLIAQLQAATEAPILCLVRAKDSHPGKRLEENFQRYGLEVGSQVRALKGDISKPDLGMQADDYQTVIDSVDVIFHCAAFVNYVHGYSVLKPHTVAGTREILRLACRGRGKTLHFVSTNGIYPGGSAYPEDLHIDPYLEDLQGGYGLAKWVAEKLVWQAHDRGLPVIIYRPGNIGHHTETGAANPNDFQYLMMRGCQLLGKAPRVDNWFFEFTPVDFLARAMVEFSKNEHWNGRVFNVVQQPTLPARPFFEQLIKDGVLEGYLPLPQWLGQLRRAAEAAGEDSLEVLADSLPDVEGYLTDTSQYDGQQFRRAYQKAGLTYPGTGHHYLKKMLNDHSSHSQTVLPSGGS